MYRKFKKGDALIVGNTYGYGDSGNQFKLLCLHGIYAWIEWQSDDPEIETIYLDRDVYKNLFVLK